jgi:hypothetical protein
MGRKVNEIVRTERAVRVYSEARSAKDLKKLSAATK